jgi:hypothetical protein
MKKKHKKEEEEEKKNIMLMLSFLEPGKRKKSKQIIK